MGSTKSALFTAEQNRIAELAKAIGHPARIAILQILMQRGCVCGELVEELPLSQSTVSQHLKALKQAEIIKGEITGVRTCYCINEQVWKQLSSIFGAFFQKANCC